MKTKMMRFGRWWTAALIAACAAMATAANDAVPVASATNKWDFSRSAPEGCTVRPGSDLRGGGLLAKDALDKRTAAGCVLAQKFAFPEAFRFAAQFSPTRSNREKPVECILWDDMYVNYAPKRNNRGLQVLFRRQDDRWTPILHFGFSNDTLCVTGPTCVLKPGQWADFAFTYDANRRIVWEINGAKSESFLPRAGAFAPGAHRPVIGDRVGGDYHPFDGAVKSVSVVSRPREPFGLAVLGRKAFERAEPHATLRLELENFVDSLLTDVSVQVHQLTADAQKIRQFDRSIAVIRRGEKVVVDVPVETRLRPGKTRFAVTAAVRYANAWVRIAREVEAAVGPRFGERMPTLMWGFGRDVAPLADFGFTHGLDYGVGLRSPQPTADAQMRQLARLDEALAAGVRLAACQGVVYPPDEPATNYYRRSRTGAYTYRKGPKATPAPEVSHPALLELARATAATNALLLGGHPALAGVLPCSEARDESFPSFNTEAARYQKETGRDVPAEVDLGRTFNLAAAKKRFPDGVVPADDPILAYYRWFWKGGDGWPAFTGGVADAYRRVLGRYGDAKRQAAHPFFSFWDPAVRCPPVWGSGGDVDVLSQWIYAVPEPMNVAGPADEAFAMAAGRPEQQVMMMTQLICYRAQIAPSNVVVTPAPAWLAKRPRAAFPTIPPDTLQEATWCMLAKPVQGIMFHGWGTIFETGSETGYCFTNEETPRRLKNLLRNVVAPLGPALRRLDRETPPVAVLESATTALMGGPASWGWTAPSITYFQRARLDPRVVYEETILRDGLGGTRVLYAPQCRFLTPDVVARIRDFQKRGGVLVGDEETLPALKPDVLAPLVSFREPPASDHTEEVEALEAAKSGDGRKRAGTVRAKAHMLRQAEEIRAALAAKGYRPDVDSSSPEIITFARRWKGVPYVVAVNDKRTFGDYVGPWGLTMEKGLPFEGEVSLFDSAKKVEAVYELSQGGRLPFSRTPDGRVAVPVSFKTNDGRLLAFLPTPIAKVRLRASLDVPAGGVIQIAFHVLGPDGKPVPGVLPAEVRVTDGEGREIDGAGWTCTVDGQLQLSVQTNLDDKGDYTVLCRDRASGLYETATVVRGRKAPWWKRLMR